VVSRLLTGCGGKAGSTPYGARAATADRLDQLVSVTDAVTREVTALLTEVIIGVVARFGGVRIEVLVQNAR
jgi:hypothetical protein